MNRRQIARVFFWTSFVLAVLSSSVCLGMALIYRFQNPDLSETRLFMASWLWYLGAVAGAFAAANWWNNRPGT